ncbi:MAG: hypothetical protein ACTSVC_12365 [Promethearchaeota archaeon]
MSNDEKDFLIKRGEYSENLAAQHRISREFDKELKFLKEAFKYYKKAGDKEALLRVKNKYDNALKDYKASQGEK